MKGGLAKWAKRHIIRGTSFRLFVVSDKTGIYSGTGSRKDLNE
jgi:hypothetical protein